MVEIWEKQLHIPHRANISPCGQYIMPNDDSGYSTKYEIELKLVAFKVKQSIFKLESVC